MKLQNRSILSKRINRVCAICGKPIKITIHKDRTYKGGYYWNFDLGTNNKHCEYWECTNCYLEGFLTT